MGDNADSVAPQEHFGAASIFRPRTAPAQIMAATRRSHGHKSDRVENYTLFQETWARTAGVRLSSASRRSQALGRPYDSEAMLHRHFVPLGLQVEHGGLPRWPA